MIEANYDEVICPNCVTQFRAIPVNVQSHIRQQEDAIERLENEAVAATLRIENDKLEVLSLTDGEITAIVQQVASTSDRPIGAVEYGVLVARAIERAVRGDKT